MLPPAIFTQPPPPLPGAPWMMSPHLRGSIRPAISEPHLPAFGTHQRSQSPLGRHPRAALPTNVPPPHVTAFGSGGNGGPATHPPSFYDDGSCLSVAKQLSQSRLGAFPAAEGVEAAAAAAAGAPGGSDGPAGGASASSHATAAPQQQYDGRSAGGTSGRSHSPLARQFPISSAYEPFIRSLSPLTHQQQQQHDNHLRVTGPSRRGRSVSPDVHGRPGIFPHQQAQQAFAGGAVGGAGFEQQFPPPHLIRGRMQPDAQTAPSPPLQSRASGNHHHPNQPAAPAITRLTRQNSCSDTQLNAPIGETESGRYQQIQETH